MIKVLITGIDGFIGSYLAEHLLEMGRIEVYGTVLQQSGIENIKHLRDKLHPVKCDIRNRLQVENVVDKANPDIIFHLASQAYVIPSWHDPVATVKTNVLGTIHLFETVRNLKIDPVIILACSSAEYGDATAVSIPLKETDPLLPLSPYGVSKVAMDLLGYQYYRNFGLKVIRTRIFGTIGARKIGDAIADFAEQVAKIEVGLQKPMIFVGNLKTKRDLTDVRDTVEALHLLSIKGKYGDVYNINRGQAYEIGDLLKNLLSMTEVEIKTQYDPKKMRFSDEAIILGDNEKIKKECGWNPEISIEKTLHDILNYWRARYNGAKGK